MSATASRTEDRAAQGLQCMEIWGGNSAADREVTTPGLDIWVKSTPHEHAADGGDVHYVSLCGGGKITRLILADVSGHGASAADVARSLRDLMRRNINRKSQSRLVRDLNRQFAELAQLERFATAIVATYLTDRDMLTICNAGHPRPFWYRAATDRWHVVDTNSASSDHDLANLPLGIDESSAYPQIALPLAPGDRVLLYTDALIEATDSTGEQLGEVGLLRLLNTLPPQSDSSLLQQIERRVASYQSEEPDTDDKTLMLLHHNAQEPGPLSLRRKFDVYAKVFGLKRI